MHSKAITEQQDTAPDHYTTSHRCTLPARHLAFHFRNTTRLSQTKPLLSQTSCAIQCPYGTWLYSANAIRPFLNCASTGRFFAYPLLCIAFLTERNRSGASRYVLCNTKTRQLQSAQHPNKTETRQLISKSKHHLAGTKPNFAAT